MRIVVDAYAWIELFIGSKKGIRVKEILDNADDVFTPGTVMAEIARKYMREGVDEQTTCKRLETIAAASNVAAITNEVALEAAKRYSKLAQEAKRVKLSPPSLFDAIVLATATTLKAKVLTGDQHFKNQPETIWIG